MARAASSPSVARDHRDPAVHDDQPVEELVERADLRAAGGDRGDVLVGDRAAAGRVLVERAHLDPALDGGHVADRRRGEGGCVPARLRLGRQQLGLRVGHHRRDERVDGVAAQLGDRPACRTGGASPGLGERPERGRPVGGLGQQVGAVVAQRRDDAGLDRGGVDGGVAAVVQVGDEQPDPDQQVERRPVRPLGRDAGVVGAQPTLGHHVLVQRGTLVLEQGPVLRAELEHTPLPLRTPYP